MRLKNQDLYQTLENIVGIENIYFDELLKNHTYIKLGGKADVFITPTNYQQVCEIVKVARNNDIPITIIGNGSKLIIREGGIRGIIFSFKKLKNIDVIDTNIIAQSGADLITVADIALEHELTGVEFACGIPGTIGGAVFMNAGAYGGEMKDVLSSVLVVDVNGNLVKKDAKELKLDYRYSNISETKDIVIEATLTLKKGNYEDIKAKMDELTIKRNERQPLEYPSCGSVFKRPNGYYSGKLIQDCGLQGYRIGGAEVSKKHAGFIVNVNNATANDYIALIEHIQRTVKAKFNVDLEQEVKIIGED